MNIAATFRPIHRWPQAETRNRRTSRFRATWGDTLELLQRELRHLRARSVVIQLDLDEGDIRLDGYPRANARPRTPRVILSFETPDGAFSYPCDTWSDWQDNIRAVALTLENLRAIDRHGVTKRREQYVGWKALPGGNRTGPTMTAGDAAAFLARWGWSAGELLERGVGADRVAVSYRAAAKALHPDAGGTTEDFQRLQKAKRILDDHHGRAEGLRR